MNVKISKVNVNKGELLFVIYPDSSVNLLNAIKRDSTKETKITPDLSKKETKASQPSISIEKLSITDLHLKITNDPEKENQVF